MKTKILFFLMLCLSLNIQAEDGLIDDDFVVVDSVLIEYKGEGGDVIIPNTVTSIAKEVFRDNKSIISLTIPNSVISMGGTFWGCDSLNTIIIADGKDELLMDGGECLFGDTSIETFYLGRNLTFNPAWTQDVIVYILQCNKIVENIVVGPEVTAGIDNIASLPYPNWVSISVDGNNSVYSTQNGILYNKEKTRMIACSKKIEGNVTIPSSVDSIGNYAILDCSNLDTVKVFWEEPLFLSLKNANSCILSVPVNAKSVYENTDIWNNFKNIVERDNGENQEYAKDSIYGLEGLIEDNIANISFFSTYEMADLESIEIVFYDKLSNEILGLDNVYAQGRLHTKFGTCSADSIDEDITKISIVNAELFSHLQNKSLKVEIYLEGKNYMPPTANEATGKSNVLTFYYDLEKDSSTVVLDSLQNIIVCAGGVVVDTIYFKGENLDAAKVKWINDNPAIGLDTAGVGHIPSFITNNVKKTETATITVIPVSEDGIEITDAAQSFTITVNAVESEILIDFQTTTMGCGDSVLIVAKVNDVINPVFIWFHGSGDQIVKVDSLATGETSSFAFFHDFSVIDYSVIDTFTVSVSAENLCIDIHKTVTLKTNVDWDRHHLEISQTKFNTTCENDTVILTASIDLPDPIYKWYDAAGNLVKTDSISTKFDKKGMVNQSSSYITTVSAPMTQDTTYKFHVVVTSATDLCAREYSDSIFVEVSPCQPVSNICSDPASLNYHPLAMANDSLSCLYAEEQHTLFVTIESEIVDVATVIPVESCDLTAGLQIASAVITSISPASANSIIAHWEITQDGKISNFDVEYTIEKEGLTLFYLSIICKSELRSSQNGENGFTVSALYDVNFGELTGTTGAIAGNIMVYPNPFTDWLNVVLKDAETADIALYSLDGKLLANYHNQNEVQIATSSLPAGSYIVKVTINKVVKTMTVIKK